MDVDLRHELQHVRFPAWLADRDGRLVWLNDAASRLVGDARGQSYLSVVDQVYCSLARKQFTRKLLGTRVTDYEIVLRTQDGSGTPIEVSSVRVDGPSRTCPGRLRPRQGGGHQPAAARAQPQPDCTPG